MTQYSWFHNGASVGNASLAPYTDETTTTIENILHSGRSGVIYGNVKLAAAGVTDGFLAVTRVSANSFRIAPGSAILDGVYVENTANIDTTHLRSCTGAYWIRVVANIFWSGSINFTYLRGTDAFEIPEIPPLINSDSPYKAVLPLARIYIPSSGDVIQTKFIFDERVFLPVPSHLNTFITSNVYNNVYGGSRITNSTNTPAVTQFLIHARKGYTSFYDSANLVCEIHPTQEPVLILHRYVYGAARPNALLSFTPSADYEGTTGAYTTSYGYIPAPFVYQREVKYSEFTQFGAFSRENLQEIAYCRFGRQSANDTLSAGTDTAYDGISNAGNTFINVQVGRLPNGTYRYKHAWVLEEEGNPTDTPNNSYFNFGTLL